MTGAHAPERDRDLAEEMLEHIKQARDLARWLGVHRRHRAAEPIERVLDAMYFAGVQLRGIIARADRAAP